jgi:hypothetical protein
MNEAARRDDKSLALAQTKLPSKWKVRFEDRTKWPRKWWRPLPKELNLSADDWKKQHDEIFKAINKLLLVLIGFCFFCGLALGKPDVSLIANDAKVTLPFANADVSFVAFLIIAPLVLTALSFYLHIFVGYWITLSRQMPGSSSAEQTHPVLPFVFNLPYRTADWLSVFLFYWLVPIMLGYFAWEALPRPEAPRLIALTSTFVVVFLFLQLRRRYEQTLPIISLLKWLMFLGGVSIAALAFYAWGQRRPLLSRQLQLPKAELKDQDLQNVNISGADLTGAHLDGTDLMFADLHGANLTGAHLHGAYLMFAVLNGAVLNGAYLHGAYLNHAYLDGADLTGAVLNGAYFHGANLNGADLIDAHLTGADLTNADLTLANLTGANLTGAKVTQQQIDTALGTQKTRLPTGLKAPTTWK